MRLSPSDRLSGALARAGGNAVIVFDGHCVLCSASARFVLQHDRARRFRLTTAQSGTGQALYRVIGLPPEAFETMLVVQSDAVHTHSDAALAVAAGLGWPWRAAALARIVPASIRDALYRVVARNRFRWFGRRDTCWVPSRGDADRIL